MNSLYADAVLPHRVSPFGYLRIEAYLQLPEAFRSLSRPSSAPDAKAFPLRSFMLDLRRSKLTLLARFDLVRSFADSSELCRLSRFLYSEIVFTLKFKSSTICFLKFVCLPAHSSLLPCLSFLSLFSFQGAIELLKAH